MLGNMTRFHFADPVLKKILFGVHIEIHLVSENVKYSEWYSVFFFSGDFYSTFITRKGREVRQKWLENTMNEIKFYGDLGV